MRPPVRRGAVGAGAIIILLGGLGVLGLALSPLLWTRDAADDYRLKRLRSGALLAILFVGLAVLHYFATKPIVRPQDRELFVIDVDG